MDTTIRFPYPHEDNSYQLPDPKRMDGDGHIEKPLDKPGGRTRRAQFVKFSNEGFTKWHHHIGDQILFAIKGKGFVELERQSKIAFQAGEHIYIPENVRHRQGAIKGEPTFIHLAVTARETQWEGDNPSDPQIKLIDLNQKILEAEEEGDQKAQEELELVLTESFYIVRAKGNKQSREDFLKDLPKNVDLRRSAEEP